jgi:hypothetical protein
VDIITGLYERLVSTAKNISNASKSVDPLKRKMLHSTCKQLMARSAILSVPLWEWLPATMPSRQDAAPTVLQQRHFS